MGRTHDQIVRPWRTAVAVAAAALALAGCAESASETGRRLRDAPSGVTTTAPTTVPPGSDDTVGSGGDTVGGSGDEIRPLPE